MSRCDPKLPARSFGGQHLLGLEPATPPPVAQKYGRTEGEQAPNRSPSHKGHPHPDASSPTSLSDGIGGILLCCRGQTCCRTREGGFRTVQTGVSTPCAFT